MQGRGVRDVPGPFTASENPFSPCPLNMVKLDIAMLKAAFLRCLTGALNLFGLVVATDDERDGVIERIERPRADSVKGCPQRMNSTTLTDPGGFLGLSVSGGATRSTRESGKIEA
jgi:hypothetical protein